MELPDDAALYGCAVTHVSGVRLGRIEAVVHRGDGERVAVVRRSRLLRRWYWVSLAGARVDAGGVLVRG